VAAELSGVRHWCWLLLAGAVALLGEDVLAVTPLGVEFQVNSHTPNHQFVPDLAIAPGGSFIVVWEGYQQNDLGFAIFAQRFDSSGAALAVEFMVNSFTDENYDPEVAADASGDFVVVWRADARNDAPNGDDEVYGQRFDSNGGPSGLEFRVNSHTLYRQLYPTVAMEADGDFVVAWSSAGQDGDDGPSGISGIFAQRFGSSGASKGLEFMVNTFTSGQQRSPAIAAEDNGDFVITWESNNADDDSYGIRGQRFDSAGAKLGTEFAVNSFTTGTQYRSAVAMDDDGDFVVVWTSSGQPQVGLNNVYGQRFASSGASFGGEFLVNESSYADTYLDSLPVARAVAMDADGDFAVVWTDRDYDNNDTHVQGRLFGSNGSPGGPEFAVSAYTAPLRHGAVAMAADGDFVVVWQNGTYGFLYGSERDGSGFGVFGRRFAAPGAVPTVTSTATASRTPTATATRTPSATATRTPTATATRTATRTATASATPTRTSTTNVTPTRTATPSATATRTVTPSATSTRTLTRTATPTATVTTTPGGRTLDIDGNGLVEALTDGLLVLRRLFGFSGPTLIGGALGNGCTRCDASSIANYIDANLSLFDIDDNDSILALTDGLLILRRLFGFSGSTLVTGAVGPGCMRCDAPSIAAYIDDL
jgi:hypothetical protein